MSSNDVVVTNGSQALTSVNLLNGQMLIGGNGVAPIPNTLSGTVDQITVTNGSGSITLSLPQNIDTSAVVNFDALTLAGNLTCNNVFATNSPSSSIEASDLIQAGLTMNTPILDYLTSGGSLAIGPSNATKVDIAQTSVTTEVHGPLKADVGVTFSNLTANCIVQQVVRLV